MNIRWNAPVVVIALSISAILAPEAAHGASYVSPPALPAPSGRIVTVATEPQLQSAVSSAVANTTIIIAPGTYVLSAPLYLNGVDDVTLRGATNNRDDVVLAGRGMTNGAVEFGIWTNGQRITIANLTVRDVYDHAIILNAGAQSPRIYNVHLINTGQQFIKSNPNGSGGGVNNGIVEYSVIEYEATSRDDYTNGVDVHSGDGWIVRNNLFRNLTAPGGALAGPAILMWNGSSGAVIEGNTFLNCQREISMGLTERSPDDNSGGIVRNNFIYRDAGIDGDAGILLADSPGTQVLHNTVVLNGTYPNAIEYRFGGTRNVLIANNLTSAAIQARDGATGTATANYVRAAPSMFADPSTGDLHLLASATAVIDKVEGVANAPTDWDEQPRPASLVDYGADELAGTTEPPAANQAPLVSLTSPTSGTSYTAPTSVPLSAEASDNDGTIATVSFYNGSTLIGTATSGPYAYTWSDVPAGIYTLTAIAVDNSGAATTSSSMSIEVSGGADPSALPTQWTGVDIGSPVVAGNSNFSSSTFTVVGGGSDIWNTSDQFRFVYRQMTGDGEIIARVASLTNPDSWAKAGVMIRQSLTADSAHAMALVSSENGVNFQRRLSAGSESVHTAGVSRSAPYWVRLVRTGSTFTAYSSATGSSWTTIGSDTISLGATVYVGLAVTGHNSGAAATATFTNVAVSGSTSTPTPPTSPTPPTTPATLSLVFTPSADHSSNVTSYTLQLFTAGANPATAQPVASLNLGKPVVVGGTITVNIVPVVAPLPSGSYVASVIAVGPGGSTRGASSGASIH